MVNHAVELAKSVKKVVIISGLPDTAEAEGIERSDMKMPFAHNRLIYEVAKANPNVAVVLCCGSVVETPWADQVKSILYMGLSGQAGAGALVNLLSGKANPSGKLAETWPMQYEDCPSAEFYAKDGKKAEYLEGIYVGYRYYEKAGKNVRFPFGAGLSYTEFAYDGLYVKDNKAYITITNTGSRFGGEPVLMYIHAPGDEIHRPVRELKGFEKIFLAPGEKREVCFELDERSFAVWYNGWKVYAGNYKIQIGSCEAQIQLPGEIYQSQADQGWYQTLQGTPDRADWIRTLGRKPPNETSKRPYTINSSVEDIEQDSLIIRLMMKYFENLQAKTSGKGTVEYKVAIRGAKESPLRNVQNSMMIKGHFAQAIADIANKKYIRGFWNLIRLE